MELPPGEGDGGSVVPLPVTNSYQIGVGTENQNAEGVVESNTEIEPDIYDFSSFLEGDIVNDVFPEFYEILKAASLPRIGLVVPEMVEDVVTNKNMQHHVQPPPPSPPPPLPPPPPPPPLPLPPQLPRPGINSNANVPGNMKWTEELHAIFVEAVKQLGGALTATPKTVRNIMKVEGLTLHQVKSHLQKYRMEKSLCDDLKKLHKRGSSFGRSLSAPTEPATSSKPRRTRKSRAKVKRQERGSLHMKIQYQQHLQQLLEMQRQYAQASASWMAANQTMGGYTSAAYQNMGGYPFAANQNIGRVFALNQNIGGYALAGMTIYPENSFVREATVAPMQSCYPYQLNQYEGCTSAAAVHAGAFIPRNPVELQSIAVAYPHQLTQASFPAEAGSGSDQQGFNSDAGESSGTAGMSDEEFVESVLIDFDELIGDSQDDQ